LDAKEPLNKQNLSTADDVTNKLRLGDSMNVVYSCKETNDVADEFVSVDPVYFNITSAGVGFGVALVLALLFSVTYAHRHTVRLYFKERTRTPPSGKLSFDYYVTDLKLSVFVTVCLSTVL
jgi:hypothetical protein